MQDIIATILTGNIGTVILVLILWKAGVLKFLLNGKKERDYNDGKPITTIQEVANTVAKLEQHFNNDTTVLLTEINQQLKDHGQKLEKISDGIIFIKARMNGKTKL